MTRNCIPCDRTSENKNFDCPARMSDGRVFTDYRPRCDINFIYPVTNTSGQYMDSYEYRQALIKNADTIMSTMRGDVYNSAVCAPCVSPYNKGTMLPEHSIQKCNTRTCTTTVSDSSGLGLGRQYNDDAVIDTDRAKFLAFKEQETQKYAASANCCASPADWRNYYSPDASMAKASAQYMGRWASPFGGMPLSGGDPSTAKF